MPHQHLIHRTQGSLLGNSSGGNNSFNGTISNVAFWTIAHSTAQVQADMQACTLSPQTGLAAYWQMNEGTAL